MKLVENYLSAVAGYLPRGQRDDGATIFTAWEIFKHTRIAVRVFSRG